MGIRTDPIEYSADDCNYFAADETPLHMWVTFSGILPGNWEPSQSWLPPNGTHKLFQDSGQPCSWEAYAGGRAISYSIKTPNAHVSATDYERNAAFTTDDETAGTTFFENKMSTPVNNYYYGGTAQIMWLPPEEDPSILNALAELNIEPGPDVLVEFFPVSSSVITVKVCRKSDKSNISFRFSY